MHCLVQSHVPLAVDTRRACLSDLADDLQPTAEGVSGVGPADDGDPRVATEMCRAPSRRSRRTSVFGARRVSRRGLSDLPLAGEGRPTRSA